MFKVTKEISPGNSGFWFQVEWLILYATAGCCMICFPLLILGLYKTKQEQATKIDESEAMLKKAK
jgi:hypothetical protein